MDRFQSLQVRCATLPCNLGVSPLTMMDECLHTIYPLTFHRRDVDRVYKKNVQGNQTTAKLATVRESCAIRV